MVHIHVIYETRHYNKTVTLDTYYKSSLTWMYIVIPKMKFVAGIIILFIFLGIADVNSLVNGRKYEDEIPIFASDDFRKCRSEGNLFCRIKFSLSSTNNHSDVWQEIKETKSDPHAFAKDVVYRLRCLPNALDGREDEIMGNVTENENKYFKKLGLKTSVLELQCNNYDRRWPIRSFDLAVLYSTLTYFGLLVLATLFDLAFDDIETSKKIKGNFRKYMKALSLSNCWKQLVQPKEGYDFQKLKSLQGVRTFNIMIVVLGHTIFVALFADVADYKYVEDFYASPFRKPLLNWGLQIVQTNFLISAWLFANSMYKYLETHKDVPMKYMIKGIILRYFRLLPPLAFAVAWEATNWLRVLVIAPPSERMDIDYKACQKNWWVTLLFSNSFLFSIDMCNLGTWYLADEFQMFVLAMLLFFVMIKFKFDEKLIAGVFVLIWAIHARAIYNLDQGIIFNFTPENAKVENSIASPNLYVLYTSFYANFGAYAIGLIFGRIYYKYKHHTIKVDTKLTVLWAVLFAGLPILSVYLTTLEYSRFVGAIVGATVKPMYAIGIGIGLLGMSHGIGGPVRKLCEHKVFDFLANWSYCTYIIHFGIVFGRVLFAESLIEVSDLILFKSSISDIIQSFFAGLVLHLIIERPISNLIKIFINKEVPEEVNHVKLE